MQRASSLKMSSATLVEARAVMTSRAGAVGRRLLASLVKADRVEIVALTSAQADLASQAFSDSGRGSGSPAKLHYGDCFSYDLAAQWRQQTQKTHRESHARVPLSCPSSTGSQ